MGDRKLHRHKFSRGDASCLVVFAVGGGGAASTKLTVSVPKIATYLFLLLVFLAQYDREHKAASNIWPDYRTEPGKCNQFEKTKATYPKV